MVDRRSASLSIIEDTASVQLEGVTAGSQGDGHRPFVQSSLQSCFRVANLNHTGCFRSRVLGNGGRLASAIVRGSVRIAVLRSQAAVCSHPTHRFGRPSAVAAALIGVAIDHLLLGKRTQRTATVLDSEGALDGGHCGEGPARTALSLVLHWRHGRSSEGCRGRIGPIDSYTNKIRLNYFVN